MWSKIYASPSVLSYLTNSWEQIKVQAEPKELFTIAVTQALSQLSACNSSIEHLCSSEEKHIKEEALDVKETLQSGIYIYNFPLHPDNISI